MITLNNKIAIITGGSRGIGAATALMLAQAGAHIVITYTKNEKAAKYISQKIRNIGKECIAIKADISKEKNAKMIVEKTLGKFGRIDILVNNAGIWTYGLIG